MSQFSSRLAELGFASYSDYLHSKHWSDFKSSYRAAGLPMRCAVCGVGRIQLHHKTYIRLGAERHEDVVPVCRMHHEAVHHWLKASGRIFVEYTHEAIAALCGKPVHNPNSKQKLSIIKNPHKKNVKARQSQKCSNRKTRTASMSKSANDSVLLACRRAAIRLHNKGFLTDGQRAVVERTVDTRIAEVIVKKGYMKQLNRLAAKAKIDAKCSQLDLPPTTRPRSDEPFKLNARATANTSNWSLFLKRRYDKA